MCVLVRVVGGDGGGGGGGGGDCVGGGGCGGGYVGGWLDRSRAGVVEVELRGSGWWSSDGPCHLGDQSNDSNAASAVGPPTANYGYALLVYRLARNVQTSSFDGQEHRGAISRAHETLDGPQRYETAGAA